MPRRAFSDRPPWRHGNCHESRNCVAGTQAVSSFATRSSDHAFLVGREPRQLRCGQGCSTVAVVPLHQCQSPKPLSEKTTDLGSCENSVFFSLRCRPKVASPQCPPISGDAVQAPKLGSVRLSELIFCMFWTIFQTTRGNFSEDTKMSVTRAPPVRRHSMIRQESTHHRARNARLHACAFHYSHQERHFLNRIA